MPVSLLLLFCWSRSAVLFQGHSCTRNPAGSQHDFRVTWLSLAASSRAFRWLSTFCCIHHLWCLPSADMGTCAQELVAALPELLGHIQGQLLDLLSLVLARRLYREGLPQLHLNALHQAVAHGQHLSYPPSTLKMSTRILYCQYCMELALRGLPFGFVGWCLLGISPPLAWFLCYPLHID